MKISIVLCSFNGEKYIKKQLDSIIYQTYQNFELLVFDDGSTDKTIDIVQSYQKQYQNIKLYQNKKQLGVIKNFEHAITMANGDLIALSDQDDIWDKDKLKVQTSYFLNYSSPLLVYSDMKVIDKNDNLIYNSFFKFKGYNIHNFNTIISRGGIMGNTIMFNKELKNLIIPFYDDIPMHDYYIGVVAIIYGKTIKLDKKLIKYRLHNSNIGNKKKSLKEKLKDFCNLPYKDRINFLLYIYKNIDNLSQKHKIKKFLNTLEYDSLLELCIGVKNHYFKDKIFYHIKLIFRFLLCKMLFQPFQKSYK